MNRPKYITDRQADRFWAIAFDTGYTRAGANRLLADMGYDEAENVRRDDYEDLIEMAEDEELAFSFNRDPDTPDLFSGETPESPNR